LPVTGDRITREPGLDRGYLGPAGLAAGRSEARPAVPDWSPCTSTDHGPRRMPADRPGQDVIPPRGWDFHRAHRRARSGWPRVDA